MNKRQKEDLDLILRSKQSRTLLIYNICEICKDKNEILQVLESELKELGVFEK